MINYTPTKSPFYDYNEQYCKEVENISEELNAAVSGFCNSYGYEVKLTFSRSNVEYRFSFLKNQSTQNGVVLPVNANDYVGVTMEAKMANINSEFRYGKSFLKNLFTKAELKIKIPTGYYLQTRNIDVNTEEKLAASLAQLEIGDAEFKNGKLKLSQHLPRITPIHSIEKLMQFSEIL